MTNLKNLLNTAVCLLLCGLVFSSCKVDKVEQNLSAETFSLRNAFNCAFYFRGIVRDANTMEIIPDAKVELKEYGLETTSDLDGVFTLKITINEEEMPFWEGGKMIKISKDDYVSNTLEIDFSQYFTPNDCGNFYATKIDADILLTPERPIIQLPRNGFDAIVFDSFPASFTRTGDMVKNKTIFWFPRIETTEESIPIRITPLDINQTMGTMNQPSGAVFRFSAEPNDMVFKEPAMVKFKPIRNDMGNPVYYYDYVLNKTTNRWERQEDSFFNIMDGGLVVLNYYRFAEHLIVAEPHIKIETDTIRHRELTSQTTANCDCGEPMFLTRDFRFEDRVDESFEIEKRFNELPTRIMMADLRTTLNIPTFAAELDFRFINSGYTTQDGKLATLTEIMFDREITLEATADKCSVKSIMVREQIRDISGTMNGIPFKYSTVIAIHCGEVAERCPTSSNCHQGCPD